MTNYGISDQELTAQGIFNKAATHLLTQKARAVDKYSACVLRTNDGKACAVGCLLRDDEITSESISESAGCTAFRLPKFEPFFLLLRDLQDVHDGEQPDGWLASLRRVAKQHGLAMPEVTP